MPAFDVKDALAALDRRVAIARERHRRVPPARQFSAVADDILSVSRLIAANHVYPGEYGLKAEFEQLVADWQPQLLAGPTAGRA